jgi:hypothetical protein
VPPAASGEAQPASEPAANAEPESPDAEEGEGKRVINIRVFKGGMGARQ